MQSKNNFLTNQMTDDMLNSALERLCGREAMDISIKSGIPYSEEKLEFSFISLGKTITVSYPSFSVNAAVSDLHKLIILHYMDIADGMPVSDEIMSMSEIRDGIIRGMGFDRDCENIIANKIGYMEIPAVEEACAQLGAGFEKSNADICAVFDFLPNFPITLRIWFGDEDIPGSGKMFVRRSADSYLTIEDSVSAGTLILEKLLEELK